MQNQIDFFMLNEMFLNLGAINSPAELQGMLCGRMCGGASPSSREWQPIAIEFMDLEHVTLNEEQAGAIDELYQLTCRLMEDVNFSFSPLLPTDEATMIRRTQELGFWCQGFLHGLGASGLSGEAQLSGDSSDALRDLAQISQVTLEDEDEQEENEVYWQELVEYVKVAVLTIYVELSEKASRDDAHNDKGDDDNFDNSVDNSNKVVH